MSDNTQLRMYEKEDRQLKDRLKVSELVKVVNFKEDEMTVDVAPLVKTFTGNNYDDSSQVLNVKVAFNIGGGFMFKPIYKADDVGIILYLDVDSDSAIETGDFAQPATPRQHSGTDAVFLGGWLFDQTIPIEEGSIGIAHEDGEVSISLSESEIKIKGKLSIDGDMEIKGNVSLDGEMQVNGNINVNGNVNANNI